MESMNEIKAVGVVLAVTLIIVFATLPRPTQGAQFIIASWDYPDEHGQGIHQFKIYGNSTGSWIQVNGWYSYTNSNVLSWNAGVAIKLQCVTWFNSTVTGVSTTAEGKNYQRHNVTVTSGGVTVFSQNNFTWAYDDDGIYPDLWKYGYDVILNFIPVAGQIYTATVTYEIYW